MLPTTSNNNMDLSPQGITQIEMQIPEQFEMTGLCHVGVALVCSQTPTTPYTQTNIWS